MTQPAPASSPYLAFHADDPVPWMAWGPEAFARARSENKPIFVSVGFSTCYWCHAMARESFRDAGLASLLARETVCILVDRDQRPDVDEMTMAATQVYSHTGGWPTTLFLNHDGVPYFCGTYFPLEDHAKGPGIRTVVESMVHAWHHRRDEVEAQAAELEPVIRRFLEERGRPAATLPDLAVVDGALASLQNRFDPEWGGFGQGAKFPAPASLHLLQALADSQPEAATMLTTTLDRMARGGIYDQLAGGFHRYAGDRRWNRPHFEKMTAENGQLLEIYARELGRTGDPRWRRVVEETAEFLLRELTLDDGALAAALGGEHAGRPGLTYRWTHDELVEALGEEDASFLAPILGYDGPADGGGAHVLHRPRTLEEEAERRRLEVEELATQVEPLLDRLRQARRERPAPFRDEQVLAVANGFAIAGLVEAGRALDAPRWIDAAEKAALAVTTRLRGSSGEEGSLRHSDWGEGEPPTAVLADYAALVHGLLQLDAVGRPGLDVARELAQEMVERLAHPDGGFVSAALAPEHEPMPRPYRVRPVFDDALPAANGLAILALLRLAERDPTADWRQRAEEALRGLAAAVAEVDSARMLVLARLRAEEGNV